MALANELGLTSKVVSERHYLASLEKLTAGKAAAIISKATKVKISAKDLHMIYEKVLNEEMEWHHSGFYSGSNGRTMGRTYFIDYDEVEDIIKDFDRIYGELVALKKKADEKVYAICWMWDTERAGSYFKYKRYIKRLYVYQGTRNKLPKNAIECNESTYNAAKECEGRVYRGYDAPTLEEFMVKDS